MIFGDMKPVDVIEKPVIGFRRNGQTEGISQRARMRTARPFQRGVAGDAAGMCVRDGDRKGQLANFVEVVRARHFAVAVEIVVAGENRDREVFGASR